MKPNNRMMSSQPHQGFFFCQPRHYDRGQAFITLALGLTLLLCVTSCTSLYKRTRAQLPADPAAEASLRMNEAVQAENAVRKAAEQLLESLQSKALSAIRSDFDRLETAAFDFERRTLAAKDAAKKSGNPTGKESVEMERLTAEARSWLEYVRLNRNPDVSHQLQNLRALITKPAGN